jgi:hypothetical protein
MDGPDASEEAAVAGLLCLRVEDEHNGKDARGSKDTAKVKKCNKQGMLSLLPAE